ncbi:AAA family ATPase [Stakelama saccharophila]|uniref:AAA family ATPase n=1 Tax=Stakelama saccharophila TaxID=3075605 RepID=A0ABZ0B956_9SPHN|nr:AAA family ATPase [Stakelama sp. W311]WNO53747.1 AAA family ATPase [Stakelama sp. W311]
MSDPVDRLHVITGGPGSGKSTLIDALAAQGIATSPEVGRAIIKEELARGGSALPWSDHLAFAEKMVVREVAAHQSAAASGRTVVLDRGIPDVIGFLRISGLAVPEHIDRAARSHRYNSRVFIAPWWEEIFTTDPERKQTPQEARDSYAVMVATYRDYGYTPVDLPRTTVAERVAFIRTAVGI